MDVKWSLQLSHSHTMDGFRLSSCLTGTSITHSKQVRSVLNTVIALQSPQTCQNYELSVFAAPCSSGSDHEGSNCLLVRSDDDR